MTTLFVWLTVVALPIVFWLLWWIWWFLIAIIIDLIILALSIRIVRPNTVMTVERLWKYRWILRQWFHMIIPVIETTRTNIYLKEIFQ